MLRIREMMVADPAGLLSSTRVDRFAIGFSVGNRHE